MHFNMWIGIGHALFPCIGRLPCFPISAQKRGLSGSVERERSSPSSRPSMLNDYVPLSCVYYVMSVKRVFLALFFGWKVLPQADRRAGPLALHNTSRKQLRPRDLTFFQHTHTTSKTRCTKTRWTQRLSNNISLTTRRRSCHSPSSRTSRLYRSKRRR